MRNRQIKKSFAFVTPRKIRLHKGRCLLSSRIEDPGLRRNSSRFQRIFSFSKFKLKSNLGKKTNRDDLRKKDDGLSFALVLEPKRMQLHHYPIDYMPLCCEEDLEMLSKFLSKD